MKRNPSFTPSPSLREGLNKKINARGQSGPTSVLNEWFDLHRTMISMDAITLVRAEQDILCGMLEGVFIDAIAIQSIPNDIHDTDEFNNKTPAALTLNKKLSGKTFGQIWATLEKYGMT